MSNAANPRTLLIVGGSGFLSGTLARTATARGYQVWTITRGRQPLPAGAANLRADRHDPAAFARAVAAAQTHWDLVVDCIGYEVADARQDIEVFRERTRHFVFVSTDFVFDPAHRRFPQSEETEYYLQEGYGGNKRLCELEFINGDTGSMAWTILRPCHIYGPGSQLGCLPLHGRDPQLIAKLRSGQPLQLVGGGHFLQQPILAADLAALILSAGESPATRGQIFCTAGPELIESRDYYRIIADILEVDLCIKELPVDQHLSAHPETATFLCHRIYDLSKLRTAGVELPATPLAKGLRQHVESLLPG